MSNDSQGFLNAAVLRAFAEALIEIPLTLAENAGLNGLKIISELKTKHELEGNKFGNVTI
jgi:chaperonin GroEL (HSP60 family)